MILAPATVEKNIKNAMEPDEENQKDLTGIILDPFPVTDFVENNVGQPAHTQEKIESFESLEEYSATETEESHQDTLDEIRNFSETVSTSKPTVTAGYPFSIRITGMLSQNEKEKILELLSRENLGIREIELEAQFSTGKILIPRISEYAGILIIQSLNTSSAKIEFGPSDQIYSTKDSQDQSSRNPTSSTVPVVMTIDTKSSHLAEALPITSTHNLPNIPYYVTIDTLVVSATLKAEQWNLEHELQKAIHSLQKELKYQAFYKGGKGIVDFKIQLYPTDFRLMLLGVAIKPAENSKS